MLRGEIAGIGATAGARGLIVRCPPAGRPSISASQLRWGGSFTGSDCGGSYDMRPDARRFTSRADRCHDVLGASSKTGEKLRLRGGEFLVGEDFVLMQPRELSEPL